MLLQCSYNVSIMVTIFHRCLQAILWVHFCEATGQLSPLAQCNVRRCFIKAKYEAEQSASTVFQVSDTAGN